MAYDIHFGHLFHHRSSGYVHPQCFKSLVHCLNSVSLTLISLYCFQILLWLDCVPATKLVLGAIIICVFIVILLKVEGQLNLT